MKAKDQIEAQIARLTRDADSLRKQLAVCKKSLDSAMSVGDARSAAAYRNKAALLQCEIEGYELAADNLRWAIDE